MARSGISFEEVAKVADALAAAGEKPGTRAIRAELRTGSPNTIHRHLEAWIEQRARPAAIATELPSDVARSIQSALAAAGEAAKAELASQLAHAKREASELVQAGEALEAELDALREQARVTTSELDSARGRSAEQTVELQRVEAELAQTRSASEASRVEAARLRQTVEELRAQVAKQADELQRLRELEHKERTARVTADRDLAVATTARAHLEERLREQHEREQAATRELGSLRARVDQALEREGELRAEVARCQSELSAAHQAHAAALERAKLQAQLEAAKDSGRGKPKA